MVNVSAWEKEGHALRVCVCVFSFLGQTHENKNEDDEDDCPSSFVIHSVDIYCVDDSPRVLTI